MSIRARHYLLMYLFLHENLFIFKTMVLAVMED